MSRRERQQRRRRHRGHPLRRSVLLISTVAGTATLFAALAVVGWVISVADSAPALSSLKPRNAGAVSVVYAGNGERLGFIQSDVLRQPLIGGRIPKLVKDATVAIEDRRFYKHGAIDYQGIVRAGFSDVTSGRPAQGASTLTQQLVRALGYVTHADTISRKIREAKLAQQLYKAHSRSWILNNYLNDVPYGTVGGQTAVGVMAASRLFFDKPVNRLSLPQAALLAGLPQAPSSYNPFRDPADARARRNQVLEAMVKYGAISQATAYAAMQAPLGVHANRYFTRRREQFFFDYVKEQLVERYGFKTVSQGGLRVYTTIRPDLQAAARRSIANVLNQPGDPASAVVTIDPRNGHILAMASSERYDETKFNYASQAHRQPGSTFKPFTFIAALEQGVSPTSVFWDSKPLNLQLNPYSPPFTVVTDDGAYHGPTNLFEGIIRSDNTVYTQAALDVGLGNLVRVAHQAGVVSQLDAYPSTALGGLKYGVSPLEMANAYATFANSGYRNKATAIRRVVFPDGRVDHVGRPDRTKVFPDGETYELTKALEGNIQRGTGTAANLPSCTDAGKTGTTSNFKDAWFVGYTPRLSTAVWVGYPNKAIPMTSVHGIEVFGGTFPAQIWNQYMSYAVKGTGCPDFPRPTTPFVSHPFSGKYTVASAPKVPRGFSPSAPLSNQYSNPKLFAKPPRSAPKPAPAPAPTGHPQGGPPPHGGGGGQSPGPSPGGGGGGGGGGGKKGPKN